MTEYKDLYLKIGEELLTLYMEVVVQEINDPITQIDLATKVETLLTTNPLVTRTKVVCDNTNNPQSVIDSKDCVLDAWIEIEGKQGAQFCLSMHGCIVTAWAGSSLEEHA